MCQSADGSARDLAQIRNDVSEIKLRFEKSTSIMIAVAQRLGHVVDSCTKAGIFQR
jgi:hypothetical protein